MCKQCSTRMWDDEDGVLYCPNCGWEPGHPVEVDDGEQAEADGD